jgi:hypothetical protein
MVPGDDGAELGTAARTSDGIANTIVPGVDGAELAGAAAIAARTSGGMAKAMVPGVEGELAARTSRGMANCCVDCDGVLAKAGGGGSPAADGELGTGGGSDGTGV